MHKGNKEENIEKFMEKKRAMLKGSGCKVVLDNVPLASFGSNLIYIPPFFLFHSLFIFFSFLCG